MYIPQPCARRAHRNPPADIYSPNGSLCPILVCIIRKCTFFNPAPEGRTETSPIDIYSQNVGSLYPIQVNITKSYILRYKYKLDIGYVLPPFKEYTSRHVTRRVSVRPSGAGSGKVTFQYIFICIGYLLPTFGEYMSLGGFLCALRAQGREMYIF